MIEFLIGTACGLFMGTIFTISWALVLVSPGRASTQSPFLLNRLPRNVSISVFLPLVVTGVWGLAGGILGLLLLVAEKLFPDGGLGSPNWVFTVAVLLFTANVLVLGALWVKRVAWWEGYGVGLAFTGLFGWLMPWLAS